MALWKRWKIIFVTCAVLGWWGVIFPEFTFTEDTYKIVWESFEEDSKDSKKIEIEEILNARPEQIRIRSKFLRFLMDRKDSL